MHMNDSGTLALSELAPGQPLADAQQQLKKDGCMMVARLCDPSFVAHLLAVSRHRSSEVMATLGAQTIGIGSAAGFDEVVQRSPGRWDIPISLDEFDVDDRALPWWPLITAVWASMPSIRSVAWCIPIRVVPPSAGISTHRMSVLTTSHHTH